MPQLIQGLFVSFYKMYGLGQIVLCAANGQKMFIKYYFAFGLNSGKNNEFTCSFIHCDVTSFITLTRELANFFNFHWGRLETIVIMR